MKTCVILCGGKATRLKATKINTPKCLIKIENIPCIVHICKELERAGFEKIILLTYEKFKIDFLKTNIYFSNLKSEIQTIFSNNQNGTLGDLVQILNILPNRFAVANGDTLIKLIGIKPQTLHPEGQKNYLCLGASTRLDVGQCLVEGNKVTSFKEKENYEIQKSYTYLGICSLFKKNIIAFIDNLLSEKGNNISLESDLFPILCKSNRLFSIILNDARHHDIGTVDRLKDAEKWINKNPIKLIILDRDNTINYDKGYTYKISDLKLIKKTINFIGKEYAKGSYFAVVSNQSGIGRNYFTEADSINFFNAINMKLIELNLANINHYYFCPHLPIINEGINQGYSCICRKPSPYLVQKAICDLGVKKINTIFIGDQETDKKAAKLAGVKFLNINEINE